MVNRWSTPSDGPAEVEALTVTSIPKALNEAPMSSLHWKIFVFAAMGVFIDGYDFFIIAAALPVINYVWQPSTSVVGLIGASATVGAIVGACVARPLRRPLGSANDGDHDHECVRHTLRVQCICLEPAFAHRLPVRVGCLDRGRLSDRLRVCRRVHAAADPRATALRQPQLPGSRRNRWKLLPGLAFLAHHDPSAWRWMLGFGAVPAVLILVLRRQLPESPRWLYKEGKVDQAKAVLEELLQRPVVLALADDPRCVPPVPYRALFSKTYRGRVILACVPWFCMVVALYGMALFTPTILASSAFAGGAATFWTRDIKATGGALLLDFVLLAGFLISEFGQSASSGLYRMQVVGFCGMVIGLVLVSYASATSNTPLIFTGFCLFNLAVNAGPNGTTYMVPAIVFPTEIRASASGLATSAGKIGASVGIFFMPVLQQAWGLPILVLAVSGVACIGFATTAAFRGELGDELHHEPGAALLPA